LIARPGNVKTGSSRASRKVVQLPQQPYAHPLPTGDQVGRRRVCSVARANSEFWTGSLPVDGYRTSIMSFG
jgi:hypothetical protein